MKYAPYPKYKDSGVEWLGDVPVGWKVLKLAIVAQLQGGFAFNANSFRSAGVPVIRMNNLKRGCLDISEAVFIDETDCIASVALQPNDILFGMSGSIGDTGSLGNFAIVAKSDLPAQLNQRVGRFLCDARNIVSDYTVFFIQSSFFYRQILLYTTGTAQFNVSSKQIESCTIPLPPLPEQQTIAAFLDQQCGHIDSLIEKKKRMLELIDEKRRALITQAVTRGLDPSVPMKDSGVEWLGIVPVEWKVKRLRFHSSINPPKSELRLVEDSVVSFVPMESVGENGGLISQEKRLDEIGSGYTYFAEGDVLIAKITPCFENGKGALATSLASGVGFGSTEFHVVRSLNAMIPLFFFYISISQLFRKTGEAYMYGAGGQKRIPDTFIRDFLFPLPPLPEQQAIADYLDTQTAALDKQRKSIETSIELLREYRASLITHAVTGKIDVRNFSPAQ